MVEKPGSRAGLVGLEGEEEEKLETNGRHPRVSAVTMVRIARLSTLLLPYQKSVPVVRMSWAVNLVSPVLPSNVSGQ